MLKVGHHGSAYGTTQGFLRAVDPGAAIVSVGRDNLFGHPSPVTIATLASANVRTYRTDRDGAITVRSDGSSYAIDAFLQRSKHQLINESALKAGETTEGLLSIQNEALRHQAISFAIAGAHSGP